MMPYGKDARKSQGGNRHSLKKKLHARKRKGKVFKGSAKQES